MPSCKDIKRIVPRARMQEGIDKCKENIADYLQDALLIANTGRLYHAIISLEFALEEFGKMLLLKESMNKETGDSIRIDGNEFCSHDKKLMRALEFIDSKKEYRVLWQIAWLKMAFPLGFYPHVTISSETRLSCSFVDYKDNNWTLGKIINPDSFKKLISAIEQELNKL